MFNTNNTYIKYIEILQNPVYAHVAYCIIVIYSCIYIYICAMFFVILCISSFLLRNESQSPVTSSAPIFKTKRGPTWLSTSGAWWRCLRSLRGPSEPLEDESNQHLLRPPDFGEMRLEPGRIHAFGCNWFGECVHLLYMNFMIQEFFLSSFDSCITQGGETFEMTQQMTSRNHLQCLTCSVNKNSNLSAQTFQRARLRLREAGENTIVRQANFQLTAIFVGDRQS